MNKKKPEVLEAWVDETIMSTAEKRLEENVRKAQEALERFRATRSERRDETVQEIISLFEEFEKSQVGQ